MKKLKKAARKVRNAEGDAWFAAVLSALHGGASSEVAVTRADAVIASMKDRYGESIASVAEAAE